jgi:Uma2 family endonuclease
VVVSMNQPSFRHGEVCLNIAFLLKSYVRPRKLGRVIGNDAGVLTEREPDTVRGPDSAYFSYARLPLDTKFRIYPPVAPDVAVEVRSPTDRWAEIHRKVGEYLAVGVIIVCVVDYEARTVSLFFNDKPSVTLTDNETLTLSGVFDDFAVPVAEIFE